MEQVRSCLLVAVLLAVATADYDNSNDEQLFQTFHGTTCNKVGLDEIRYQQLLTSATIMPLHGRVYAFPPQRCPPSSKFSQPKCACVFPDFLPGASTPYGMGDSCMAVADVHYDAAARGYTSATHVHWGGSVARADLRQATRTGVPGSSTGNALHLHGTPLVVDSFASNQLVGPWEAQLRVRPDAAPSAQGVTLMTNDCGHDDVDDNDEDKTGARRTGDAGPGGSVQLVLAGRQLALRLRFTNSTINVACDVQSDGNGWYEVVMASERTDIAVTVNGAPCMRGEPGAFLVRTNCQLYLGAHPKGTPGPFVGHLDFFRFYKNPRKCKYGVERQ